jgi:pyruvate dehydrogenase E1 component
VVPIVPDESRTFGMEGMFRQIGIYAHTGQLYEPVDSDQLMYYKEAVDGQILEEGITEAGSMASFIAAGTAYSQHGINMIPFFIYYSMFGFQRIGDLIWAACDMRAKGFMVGATAGRTTLNGEGLQHQDGHSLLNAIAFPAVRAYDPAFAYETAVIVMDGLKRLYEQGETAIYYLTVENEPYVMPPMPDGVEEGIISGIYKLSSRDTGNSQPKVQLFGSGAILRCALDAQNILAENYDISSNVWSVTSYTQLSRRARECQRWNMLHPTDPERCSYVETILHEEAGPFIAASDYVQAVAEQVSPWVPGGLFVLGTDGMGRSDTRTALRRHFEVDAECIAIAALYQLSKRGQLAANVVAEAIQKLDVDPNKIDPVMA